MRLKATGAQHGFILPSITDFNADGTDPETERWEDPGTPGLETQDNDKMEQ